MNNTLEFDNSTLDQWATDPSGPVALHMRQRLIPVEGADGVIFPPTYAGGEYNIDTLADGTRVATIDSVGSQANRLEPIFKDQPYDKLIPQITVSVESKKVSILEVGHRLGDALIRSSGLREKANRAFVEYLDGDATLLAKLAPTSIVFGAWDSRDTYAKLPRIVQSVIRAWDVQALKRSAQYAPPIDYNALGILTKDDKEKAEKDKGSPIAKRGFVHVPAVNTPGGILVRGEIQRDITVNLVALRRLATSEKTDELKKYILGLSLIVATAPIDGFLRQGCLLTPHPEQPGEWTSVARDGIRKTVALPSDFVLNYAETSAKNFGIGPNELVVFDKKRAQKDLEEAKKSGKPTSGKKENSETSKAESAADPKGE